MNNDKCPFLTGYERMKLIISQGKLKEHLKLQFEKNADHPYLQVEPLKDGKKSGGLDLQTGFLDGLQCIVCQQIPLDLMECVNCNKVLCVPCQDRIGMNHDHCCMEELDESVPDMSGSPDKSRVCPNCKDPNFKFREIQNKMVKNLLDQLKVHHKCSEKGPSQEFLYSDLKQHIVEKCDAFKY